jgi:hypothetical protein
MPRAERSGGHGCLAIMGSVSGELAFEGRAVLDEQVRGARPRRGPLVRARPQGRGRDPDRAGFVESEIRQVDRWGVHDPGRPDTMPGWLRARADVAARKIVRAIVRRRRKVVITGHGKLVVLLEWLAPGLVAWLVRRFGGRFGR